MFKPDNSTITTQNMHKVSPQNYATGLPHQREQKRQEPRPHPLSHKQVGLAASPNLAKIYPFCEGKRKSSDSPAGICMKQGTREGLGTRPHLLFCREPQNSLNASASQRARHPPPLPYFLGYAKKPILNFPRNLCQSRAMPKDIIKGLICPDLG